MSGVPLKCTAGHQFLIMAGSPDDTCRACGRPVAFDPSARTYLRGRYVDWKFIPDPGEEAAKYEFNGRIDKAMGPFWADAARLRRLLTIIKGRGMFPVLLSRSDGSGE